jgi:galactokinase
VPDLRDDARDLFAAITGRRPDGLWSAPGRLVLLSAADGSNLSIAVDRRTIVAAGPRDDDVLRVVSAEFDQAVEISFTDLDGVQGRAGWATLPLGVAWALGRSGGDLAAVPGVDLVIESNVPVGAGLGSSAALASAVALALDDLWLLGFDRPELAAAGHLAESEFAALDFALSDHLAPADHLASLLGRHDPALLVDARGEVESIDVGLAAAGVTVLVIETEVDSVAPTVSVERFGEAADALRSRDFDAFARAIDEPFSGEGSGSEAALAAETARENGARAARMTSGGTLVALAPLDAVSRIQVALDGAFAEHGFSAPEVYPVRASDGAARDA